MNRELIMIAAAISISMLTLTTTTNNLSAQNYTINASNTPGNMTALVNQTAAEVGHNVSAVLNKTGEEVRSTLKELG